MRHDTAAGVTRYGWPNSIARPTQTSPTCSRFDVPTLAAPNRSPRSEATAEFDGLGLTLADFATTAGVVTECRSMSKFGCQLYPEAPPLSVERRLVISCRATSSNICEVMKDLGG